MQLKCKKTIYAVYGGGAVTEGTYQKWFAKFPAGGISLDNAPQSGRPARVDSDQIETLVENNQHYATLEVADLLRILKSSIDLHQLSYINGFDVWVAHKFTGE